MKIIQGIFFTILLSLSVQVTYSQGFLHTDGTKIVDGKGNNVLLRGIGTGNWMIQEGYMMQANGPGDTQWEFRERLIETIGEEKTNIFYDTWLENHMQRVDVDSMKAWGFNSIRVALHYKWFTPPIEDEPVEGEITWIDKGFTVIDSLLDWCSANEMYLLLDMHGAPGGQGKNADISDYNPSKPSLWENQHNKDKLIALWKKLAERYSDEPWIGGYDLINETNWDFESSGSENGCDCKQNTPLNELQEDIIDEIRKVDNNHIVFVSGNCWANNYAGLYSLANYDDNLAFTFHKYWNYNDSPSVKWIQDKTDELGVPIWMSEGGENSNTWFRNAISLMEENNIGWSWWPVKKSGINNILRVVKNDDYAKLVDYWKYQDDNSLPKIEAPTEEEAFNAVMTWADNHRFENCIIQWDVIDAMIRQVQSKEVKTYKTYKPGEAIFASDYDLGPNGYAYFDVDTADYHSSGADYQAWNQGWAYRNDGVDIEECNDTGAETNGYNIGWTADKEWMQYTIESDSVAAYTLNFRSASNAGGSLVHLEVNGSDITQKLQLPQTGGWDKWETTGFEDVILPAGKLKIRLIFDKGGSNISYFSFTNAKTAKNIAFVPVSAKTGDGQTSINLSLNKEISSANEVINIADFEISIDNDEGFITDIKKNPNNGQILTLTLENTIYYDNIIKLSYNGSSVLSNGQALSSFQELIVKNTLDPRHEIPGKIQAEDFYYNEGLVLENCSEGGQNTGYASTGDYLDYLVNVKNSGDYTINYRVSTEGTNAELVFQTIIGEEIISLDTIRFNPTGGWQNWTNQKAYVYLEKGYYKIRLLIKQGEHNLNWFELKEGIINSLNTKKELDNWIIFPNPVKEYLFVRSLNGNTAPSTISIYTLQGSKVESIKPDSNSQTIDVSNYPAGMYIIELESGAGRISQTFIVG